MSLLEIFGATGRITWMQECARAALIFFYGLALVRLTGRRVFGKWAALDIVVSIVVGSNLSRALTGSAELWGTLAATTVLMVLHGLVAHVAARSPRLSRIVEGQPVKLGEGGLLKAQALMRHAVSDADLGEALRDAGLEETAQTRSVVLEPSGKISVLRAGG